MATKLAAKPKIVIKVHGGVVQEVYADCDCEIHLYDFDVDAESGSSRAEMIAQFNALIRYTEAQDIQ